MSADLVSDFLDMMAAEKGAAANTVDAYMFDLAQFAEFCQKKWNLVTEEDIRAFIAQLADEGYAKSSVSRKISCLNDFFKFLFSENEIDQNPAANIMRPKKDKALPKFLTEKNLHDLFSAAERKNKIRHKRTAAMLKVMYACGLRVSELVSLRVDCVNTEKQHILVKGKGSKERLIPIAEEALEVIQNWLAYRQIILKGRKSPFLFPSLAADEGHVTRDTFFKCLKSLGTEAGIDGEKLSPHALRHSFATHLLHKKADLRSVQKMLGHEDISTTEIYTHIISKDLLDDVSQKHPLARRPILNGTADEVS